MSQPPTYATLAEMPERYSLTTKQLADMLGLSRNWIFNKAIRLHNPLPYARVQQRSVFNHYYDPKEVSEWMARQKH